MCEGNGEGNQKAFEVALTPMETTVLRLRAAGMEHTEVSKEIGVSDRMLQTLCEEVMEKLSTNSIESAVDVALTLHLLDESRLSDDGCDLTILEMEFLALLGLGSAIHPSGSDLILDSGIGAAPRTGRSNGGMNC